MTEETTEERPQDSPESGDAVATDAVAAQDVNAPDDSSDSPDSPDAADSSESPDSSGSPDDSGDLVGEQGSGPSRVERLENEGEIAADYLEELLDIADLDGDLDMDVEGDRAAVSIVGADLTDLVGATGEVLDALQELTRLAVYRETGERSRLMLDVSGYRAGRRAALVVLADQTIKEVRSSGTRAALDPMTSFERKVVHDAVSAAGLVSESEGVEPGRYVVILPA